MAFSLDPVLSRPYPVHWAGWETTTARLQQAGWSLSLERDPYRDAMRLAARHTDMRLYTYSQPVGYTHHIRPMMDGHRDGRDVHPFVFRHMAGDIVVQVIDDFTRFEPIDAKPQMAFEREIKSIEDFNIFATPLTRTEELIVDPNDVQALLERIKAVQSPEQARIRENNRRRDREQVGQRQVFHAQILSFERQAA